VLEFLAHMGVGVLEQDNLARMGVGVLHWLVSMLESHILQKKTCFLMEKTHSFSFL
jgi:hypothetical protein